MRRTGAVRNAAATLGVLLTLSACGGGGSEVSPDVVPVAAAAAGTQIEFLIQGTLLGSGTGERTNIEVRAPNYPGACIVRIAGVCAKPVSVTISLLSGLDVGRPPGGNSVWNLNTFNEDGSSLPGALNQPTKGPPYVAVLYSSYQLNEHRYLVKATVAARAPSGDIVQREGFVLTNFSEPFEAGFFGGGQSVQVKPSVGGLFSPSAASPRTGSVVIVQGATSGDTTGMQYAYSLAVAPAGSAASIELDPASNTGHFIPDMPGDYVVALTPVYADGRTAYPAYDLVRVAQASTTVAVNVTANPNPPPFSPTVTVSPLAADNTSRIYVDAARNGLISNIASVQGVLDGGVLGTLTQPNVTITGCARGCASTTQFAFDIPQPQLGSASHTFVANVTTNKAQTYTVTLSFLGAGTGESASQEFAEAK